MKKLASLLAALALAILAAGCGGKGSSADFPADFKVVAGDASVIVTWTAEPDVEYWIFYGSGTGISTTNWVTSGGAVIARATSPRIVTGLVNGNTYSFTINARKDGGPGGAGAPTQVAVPQLAGTNWTVGDPLGSDRLNGIATGNGALGFANIAVGANGAIFTSVDNAATTTPANPAAPADLNAVWYGGLGFVAAGANGTVLFTVDGTTWTARTSVTTASLHGGTSFGTGGYVAVGAAGTIISSSDGVEWALAAAVTPNDLHAATFGNGRYVAVGANGTIVTTTDNIAWTVAPSGTTRDLHGVAYAGLVEDSGVVNRFVAVGSGGTVLTSDDGLLWTTRASAAENDLSAIAYGGQFVAVGKTGAIATSSDGITWQARVSGTTKDLTAVARTLTGYTAVGAQGTVVSTF